MSTDWVQCRPSSSSGAMSASHDGVKIVLGRGHGKEGVAGSRTDYAAGCWRPESGGLQERASASPPRPPHSTAPPLLGGPAEAGKCCCWPGSGREAHNCRPAQSALTEGRGRRQAAGQGGQQGGGRAEGRAGQGRGRRQGALTLEGAGAPVTHAVVRLSHGASEPNVCGGARGR